MLHDSQDFDIPFQDHDDWTECGIDDPDYGESESWPSWVDQDRWEPSEDAEWSRRLEEMHQASQYLDSLEHMHPIVGDDDIAAAGLPVG
jgi:hypothetical protein